MLESGQTRPRILEGFSIFGVKDLDEHPKHPFSDDYGEGALF